MIAELIKQYPKAAVYLRHIPKRLETRLTVRTYPPGCIIHQKHYELDYFGIICCGEHRVINEFENGNVFMIEKNEPPDFIGEVTILAGMAETSVTLETITECVAVTMPRSDFEQWITEDIEFLRLVSQRIAFKLYRSSYNRGAKLFYPPNFLLLDYLIRYAKEEGISEKKRILVKKTRQQLYEELGITIKTINRTIHKLKDDGLVGIEKGKMTMDLEQYERGKKEIRK